MRRVALGIGLACTPFSGADTNTNGGDASSVTNDAGASDACAGARLCDDFSRVGGDASGTMWSTASTTNGGALAITDAGYPYFGVLRTTASTSTATSTTAEALLQATFVETWTTGSVEADVFYTTPANSYAYPLVIDFGMGSGEQDRAVIVRVGTSGPSIFFQVTQNSIPYTQGATLASLSSGQWHHIAVALAFVTDGGGAVATVTVDGTPQAEASVPGSDGVIGAHFTPGPATVQVGNVYCDSPDGGDFILTVDNVVVRF